MTASKQTPHFHLKTGFLFVQPIIYLCDKTFSYHSHGHNITRWRFMNNKKCCFYAQNDQKERTPCGRPIKGRKMNTIRMKTNMKKTIEDNGETTKLTHIPIFTSNHINNSITSSTKIATVTVTLTLTLTTGE